MSLSAKDVAARLRDRARAKALAEADEIASLWARAETLVCEAWIVANPGKPVIWPPEPALRYAYMRRHVK